MQQLYRAMDFLLEAHDEIQREVFWSVSNLFNLEVDVIFVDTTSVYFEIEGEDEAPVDDEAGNGDEGEGDEGAEGAEALRMRGHSKDARPDLAQAVVAFAVTRDGIPVRCWVWPGNTADVNVVEEVKRDLNDWKLDRVIVVADTGFNIASEPPHPAGRGGRVHPGRETPARTERHPAGGVAAARPVQDPSERVADQGGHHAAGQRDGPALRGGAQP
ncbi:MAG: hypothetical protein U5K81_06925 [Trueperaceae bacterium]|nr:hypothetical protein [Trueperaceae bacterium]